MEKDDVDFMVQVRNDMDLVLIGTALVKKLLQEYYEVRVLDTKPLKMKHSVG
jgi:hypothetical protein